MPKVRVNGEVELAYESFGEGEPLLLIMGIGAQRVLWDEEFCQQLARRGFRVIRFDNRDVGESTRMDSLPVPDVRKALVRRLLGRKVEAPYTLDDMADDTVGLLDALGIDRAHVAGLSLGGMVAQCTALRHPDRVKSLAILMSGPGEVWASMPTFAALRALTSRPPRSREGAIEHALKLWRTIGVAPHNTPEQRLRELSGLQFDRGVSPRGFARQFAAIMAAPPRTRKLANLRVPTIVIHGANDPLIPPIAGRLTASQIPGARLSVIEGMGHDLGPSAWAYAIDSMVENAHRKLRPDAKPLGMLKALTQRSLKL
jgi:pimeloyl-ACP methyl ester carboxylesterase